MLINSDEFYIIHTWKITKKKYTNKIILAVSHSLVQSMDVNKIAVQERENGQTATYFVEEFEMYDSIAWEQFPKITRFEEPIFEEIKDAIRCLQESEKVSQKKERRCEQPA